MPNRTSSPPVLRLPALKLQQTSHRELFAFAVDGRMLSRVAAVSRVKRDDDRSLEGYQRPEVLSHIGEIREYLESEDPMLPNAVVVAFDHTVRFEPMAQDAPERSAGQFGHLVVEMPETDLDRKPGWIVDG